MNKSGNKEKKKNRSQVTKMKKETFATEEERVAVANGQIENFRKRPRDHKSNRN